MNRVISFNEYDELENVIFRMKQTSAVLDLVVRHLNDHRNMNELWLELFDLNDEVSQHVFELSVLFDKITFDCSCVADETRTADIA